MDMEIFAFTENLIMKSKPESICQCALRSDVSEKSRSSEFIANREYEVVAVE